MYLSKFSVTNYKVFKEKFGIEFSKENIIILTGKNNTGKSTFLEAINQFYLPTNSKTNKIPIECFSAHKEDITIELEAQFISPDIAEPITIVKKYTIQDNGKYYDVQNQEISKKHILREKLDEILNNSPYYITPYMSTEEIDKQVQEIYTQILTSELKNLEEVDSGENPIREDLRNKYMQLKNAIPELLEQLKGKTDNSLRTVSDNVSEKLGSLFSNKDLKLSVIGGESGGVSISDIIKSTTSSVTIGNKDYNNMPLSTQGTGIKRMSLIYIIQNMIEEGLIGNGSNKMLLIDEPEAFLHPEAVRALSRSLYKIGKDMPLIISTHSPVLINLSKNHTSIQVFRIGNREAIELFQSTNATFEKDDIDNMKILNYVDSYVNEFFFADRVIIVEGDTEYIALNHYIKEKNINIHIIRARGKATICTLMKILNQFKSSYLILHDVDNHIDFKEPSLKAQLTNCKKIFSLKTENTSIYASISNFEQAIGIGDIENKHKTRKIFNIMNEEENSTTKEKIFTLFDYIFEQDQNAILGSKFLEVLSEDSYNNLFTSLLKED